MITKAAAEYLLKKYKELFNISPLEDKEYLVIRDISSALRAVRDGTESAPSIEEIREKLKETPFRSEFKDLFTDLLYEELEIKATHDLQSPQEKDVGAFHTRKVNKWEAFKNANSSNLDVTNPNTGGNVALQSDWFRAAECDKQEKSPITVDGAPLSQIANRYNDFKKKEDVIDFFEQVILKDFQGNADKKLEIIDYLETTFHQGGLLFPVTSALATGLKNSNGETICGVDDHNRNTMVNIQTTKNGFKVQEYTNLSAVLPFHQEVDHYAKDGKISAEEGKDSVIKAEATIDVNFSKDSNSPSITIESNHMEISHSGLKNHLDNRSLGQKIVDFFKNIFGLNAIENLASPPKDESVQKTHNTTPRIS